MTGVAVCDFMRYRYNLDPFYVILFALLATDLVERGKKAWRSSRPSLSSALNKSPLAASASRAPSSQ